MSYVDGNLLKGEEVCYRGKLHWVVFLRPVHVILAAVACGVGLVVPIIEFLSSEFAVTNRRVVAKVGLVQRRTIELNLSKVESIQIEQGVLDRILGAGTVVDVGTGGSREALVDIADPLAFRMAVNEAAEALASAGSVPALPLA